MSTIINHLQTTNNITLKGTVKPDNSNLVRIEIYLEKSLQLLLQHLNTTSSLFLIQSLIFISLRHVLYFTYLLNKSLIYRNSIRSSTGPLTKDSIILLIQ
ncbi:hypothetical protein HERIO_523 [Hepatospora eriocheir]|uniref:Uncharacterized protein n=1 Tax=Hepatospora eriocheir TaxID=1081669 RepID=A0A1X0QD57_9MICR|nr:hypothetical protein HERIO_523 [Hepatospora eriocheir]